MAGDTGVDQQQLDQGQLDRAASCLEAMSNRATKIHEAAQTRAEQEKSVDARIAAAKMEERRAAIDAGSGPLCFGRIDEDGPSRSQRDTWYVGRRHIEDAEGNPVVVDWRAPVSAPFYRATSVDPCGLVRRRRFSIDEGHITNVFDEDLTDPDGASGGLPDPLLAELDRGRSGQMRDIVATIAGEQDEVIRSGINELLIVQGGPGTGKTAVGLHRAAYLLFAHRDHFADHQVLVIGPNPVFLRYIAEVLPSLGERSVAQTTVTGLLVAKYRVRSEDPATVVQLKSDERMAEVIRHSMRRRIVAPVDGLELRSGVSKVRFDRDAVDQMMQRALDRNLALNTARDVFRSIVLQEAWRQFEARPGSDPGHQPAFVAAIRSDPGFKKDVDRMWPAFSPPAVIRELLGSKTKRRAAADSLLDPAEQALLHRPSAKKANEELWSAADLPLLDEATDLAVGVLPAYGHVVVDEAQDHGAMALRMLGRRAKNHSMTVLGDLAQATAPGAIEAWDEAARHLCGDPDGAVVRELTVGYRVPAAILDVANQLLREAAPSVTPARSIRPGGEPPSHFDFSDDEQMVAAVGDAIAATTDQQGRASIAVIAPVSHHDLLLAEVPGLVRFGTGTAVNLPGTEAIALLDPDQAKGLEFDAVVVVDPPAIRSAPNGSRQLYVAMTRAVQTLAMVEPT